jgi:hypothetical protein
MKPTRLGTKTLPSPGMLVAGHSTLTAQMSSVYQLREVGTRINVGVKFHCYTKRAWGDLNERKLQITPKQARQVSCRVSSVNKER